MNIESEWFRQAIDILLTDQDWKSICAEIAKKDPKLFCEAHGKRPWEVEARSIYIAKGKVAAIKFVRSVTGMELMEAKAAVEDLAKGTPFLK